MMLSLLPRAQMSSQPPSVTDEEIVQAIKLGIVGSVTPYFLPSLRGIAAYTPSTRIALVARTLFRGGQRQIDPQDIPAWATSPYTWVVFNQPCIEADDCHSAPYHRGLPVTEVAIDRNQGPRPSPLKVMAAEVTTDFSPFSLLGGLPFEHAVLVAAFAPEAFSPGLLVTASWTLADGKSRVVATGQITEEAARVLSGK